MIALVLLLGVIIACSRSSALANPLLESLLSASTEEKSTISSTFTVPSGNLSTDPRRRPEAKPEQEECENMLSYMHDGKNPKVISKVASG